MTKKYLLVFLLIASSCPIDEIKPEVDKVVSEIDRAISTFEKVSVDVTETLKELEKNIAKDASDIIKNDLSYLVQRSIAQAGTEIRCNADFIAYRMIDRLNNLKYQRCEEKKFVPENCKGRREPKKTNVEPKFCQVAPSSVEVERVQSGSLSVVDLYGYDMDIDGGLVVSVVKKDKTKTQLKSYVQTHYQMNFTLNQNMDCNSESIVWEWKGKKLGEMPVIPPLTCSLPRCPKLKVTVHQSAYGDLSGKQGEWLGKGGESKQLELVRVDLEEKPQGLQLQYRCRLQNDTGGYSWTQWYYDGQDCGTRGQGRRLTGVEMKTQGDLQKYYDIVYACHVEGTGDIHGFKNGQTCGKEDYKRLESVKIDVCFK